MFCGCGLNFFHPNSRGINSQTGIDLILPYTLKDTVKAPTVNLLKRLRITLCQTANSKNETFALCLQLFVV